MEMRFTKVATVLALMTFLTLPLWAQGGGGNPGSGNVGMGRRGAVWQTDIRNAKEELAKFEAELLRMGENEWKQTSMAWIAYDFSAQNQIRVEDSYRVAAVDPGKKAEVEEITIDPPTWGIAWGRKPPRTLKLVLTDINGTTVDCALPSQKKLGGGYIGIFLREDSIECLSRAPFPESGDQQPAS